MDQFLLKIYVALENRLREAGVLAGKSGRHMKYPYTISAKIAQFPFSHYAKANFVHRYYPLGIIVGFYAFIKIHILVNSPENVRNWAETQRRAAEKEHHH